MQLNDDKASKQNGKSGIARLLLKFSKKNRRNIIKSTKPKEHLEAKYLVGSTQNDEKNE